MASFGIVARRSLFLSGVLALARSRRFQRFDPPQLPAPAIVMIHAAGGPDSRRFPCREFASRLARAGFVVLLPSYANGGSRFEGWLQEIGSLLDQVPAQTGIAGKSVGLVGFSQGGALALVAASGRTDVGAVVVWSGNLPDDRYEAIVSLPPTLLLHGSDDTVIPLGDAEQVMRLCTIRSMPCELKVLAGQGHGFTGEAQRQAIGKTIEFLERHLR